MEYIILVGFIALVWYYFSRQGKSVGHTVSRSQSSPKQGKQDKRSQIEKDLDWLREKWHLADAHREAGDTSLFRSWYFDDATERQKRRLEELSIEAGKGITKGQASDLIGLFEFAEESDLEVLRFFKRSVKNMSETRARYEVAELLSDPENAEAWKNRPPTPLQKEFCKFFGLKLEKGATAPDVDKLIADHEEKLLEEEDPRLDEWEALSDILDELSDKDMRDDYEIKKPSMTLIKKALEELSKEGTTYQDAADDVQLVVDKLIELKPDLERFD